MTLAHQDAPPDQIKEKQSHRGILMLKEGREEMDIIYSNTSATSIK